MTQCRLALWVLSFTEPGTICHGSQRRLVWVATGLEGPRQSSQCLSHRGRGITMKEVRARAFERFLSPPPGGLKSLLERPPATLEDALEPPPTKPPPRVTLPGGGLASPAPSKTWVELHTPTTPFSVKSPPFAAPFVGLALCPTLPLASPPRRWCPKMDEPPPHSGHVAGAFCA